MNSEQWKWLIIGSSIGGGSIVIVSLIIVIATAPTLEMPTEKEINQAIQNQADTDFCWKAHWYLTERGYFPFTHDPKTIHDKCAKLGVMLP